MKWLFYLNYVFEKINLIKSIDFVEIGHELLGSVGRCRTTFKKKTVNEFPIESTSPNDSWSQINTISSCLSFSWAHATPPTRLPPLLSSSNSDELIQNGKPATKSSIAYTVQRPCPRPPVNANAKTNLHLKWMHKNHGKHLGSLERRKIKLIFSSFPIRKPKFACRNLARMKDCVYRYRCRKSATRNKVSKQSASMTTRNTVRHLKIDGPN